METVIITGGTGLIGKSLSKMLIENGYAVIIVSRNKGEEQPNLQFAAWDVNKGTIDEWAIREADHIIHLAGAGVADKRWSEKRKQEIVDSRVKSGELLVHALTNIPNKVKVFVGASGVGWYGEDPRIPNPAPFTEDAPAADDFLGKTCQLWEGSLDPLNNTSIRLVKYRTGIVLSNDGGAFAEFRKPVRMGVAGILGNGKQIISWIHIEDLCRQYMFAIRNHMVSGVYNSVAPNPVSNRELTVELARQTKGNFYIAANVPVFVLKIMLGEMSVEVLKSATVSTAKMHRLGFTFLYPSIQAAIQELVKK